jgi:cysteine desulfurase/selenocysteine lyase
MPVSKIKIEIARILKENSFVQDYRVVELEDGKSVLRVILKYARLDALERLDLEHLRSLLGPRTRLVSIAHVSNTLGCVNPVKEIAALAHAVGAKLLVDACQSVPHMPIDVRELGCDFLVASGHKMCGPTGIGFLWGRLELLEAMPPWQGGGEMIDTVTLEGVTYALPPGRFEAGTPAITQAIGLGAACDYLRTIGMAEVQAYEHELAAHLHRGLSAIPGIRIYGPPVDVATDAAATHAHRAALCAFNIEGITGATCSRSAMWQSLHRWFWM